MDSNFPGATFRRMDDSTLSPLARSFRRRLRAEPDRSIAWRGRDFRLCTGLTARSMLAARPSIGIEGGGRGPVVACPRCGNDAEYLSDEPSGRRSATSGAGSEDIDAADLVLQVAVGSASARYPKHTPSQKEGVRHETLHHLAGSRVP